MLQGLRQITQHCHLSIFHPLPLVSQIHTLFFSPQVLGCRFMSPVPVLKYEILQFEPAIYACQGLMQRNNLCIDLMHRFIFRIGFWQNTDNIKSPIVKTRIAILSQTIYIANPVPLSFCLIFAEPFAKLSKLNFNHQCNDARIDLTSTCL